MGHELSSGQIENDFWPEQSVSDTDSAESDEDAGFVDITLTQANIRQVSREDEFREEAKQIRDTIQVSPEQPQHRLWTSSPR